MSVMRDTLHMGVMRDTLHTSVMRDTLHMGLGQDGGRLDRWGGLGQEEEEHSPE